MKKIKFILSLSSFVFMTNLAFGQIGINTETPAATLDIVASSTAAATAEGFIAPRLTGEQLAAKNAAYGMTQNAVIVYVTSADPAAAGKTKYVTSAGYYYYDATENNGAGANSGLWVPISGERKQFYMPSVVLPTNPTSLPDVINYKYVGGTFTVNLFDIYKSQYGSPQVKSVSNSYLSVGSSSSDFDYFVLYYDPSVFSSVTVSAAGQLTYSVLSTGVVSEKTFMNIMFKER